MSNPVTDIQMYQAQAQVFEAITWLLVLGVLFGFAIYPAISSLANGLWRYLDRKSEREWLARGDVLLCDKCGEYYPARFADRHSKFCRGHK